MTKQPTCPQCASTDLRCEDAETRRHQCRRCLWRCIVSANGKARDWLSIFTPPSKRPSRKRQASSERTL